MPVYHSLTATTPDDPRYEIRPSHWNEAHSLSLSGSEVIQAFSNVGNVSFAVETNGRITASANVTAAPSPVNVTGANGSSVNAQTIAFSNSNGMTLGVSTAANGATVTGSYTVPTQTAFVLSNSNGVSFGTNGSTVTATVATNYMASANSSLFAATGFTTTTAAGAVVAGTHDTAGLRLAVPAYLTTARASNDAIGTNTALTAGPLAWTANSAGLSLNAGSVAGTSTGFAGANISGSITHNTAGINLSLSVAAPGGAASETIYAVGNTTVNSSGTFPLSAVSMRGYGIVSLGTSNGSILVSSPDPTTLAPNWYAVGNTTGASSSTTLAADTISIQGTGGVSVGYSNGSLIISGNTGGGGGGGVGLSAGTQSVSTGTVVFSNSNNVTFGFSGSSRVTASVGANLYALGNTTQNSSTVLGVGELSLNALGAMTAGFSNGSIQLSAPATSSLSATGNASLSVNGSTISVGANAAAVSISGNSTSAGAGYSNVSSGTVYFAGGNNITLSQNGASITISGANAGGAQTGISGIVVSNTTYTSGTVTFQNANGISFGSSGANGISASYTVPTQTNQTVGGYFVGNTTGQSSSSTVDARSISFDGAGIVSAGWSAGSVRISATQSNQAASAANGSFAFQTVSFSNANGVSFVTSAGSAIAASVETSYAASNHSHGNPTLNLTNLSGTTASNSAGFTLSLSAAAGGGVNPVVSANNGSYSFTTLSFSNANGVSFGTSAGSAVTASYTVPSVTQYFSATNTTFNGANISGSMTLNTNGLQLSMSVAAPGAAAENNAIALLGANTAGNTTATGSTIGWSGVNVTLSGTNASQVVISAPATSSLSATGQLSISTNGSTISIGVGRTISGLVLAPFGGLGGPIPFAQSSISLGQNSLYMYPVQIEDYLSMDHIRMPVLVTNSSSAVSSGQKGETFQVGIYTRHSTNGTLYSRHYSTSYTVAASYSSNVSWMQSMITAIGNSTSYNTLTASSAGLNLSASLHGPREFILPVSSVFAPGEYMIAVVASTSGAGTVGNVLNVSNMAGAYQTYNRPGVSTNGSLSGFFQFMAAGTYSATTGALPASISATQINQLGTLPMMFAATGTV